MLYNYGNPSIPPTTDFLYLRILVSILILIPTALGLAVPCTLRRSHRLWMDLSVVFSSQDSACCLLLVVGKGPGYHRDIVLINYSCCVQTLSGLLFPWGRSHCAFGEGYDLYPPALWLCGIIFQLPAFH